MNYPRGSTPYIISYDDFAYADTQIKTTANTHLAVDTQTRTADDNCAYTIAQIKSAADEMLVSCIIQQCGDYLDAYGAVPPPEIALASCIPRGSLVRGSESWLTADDWEVMSDLHTNDTLAFVYKYLHHNVVATTRRHMLPTATHIIFPVGPVSYITTRRTDTYDYLINGRVIDFSRFVKNERLSATPAVTVFFETETYLAIELDMYDNIYSSLCSEWHEFNKA